MMIHSVNDDGSFIIQRRTRSLRGLKQFFLGRSRFRALYEQYDDRDYGPDEGYHSEHYEHDEPAFKVADSIGEITVAVVGFGKI